MKSIPSLKLLLLPALAAGLSLSPITASAKARDPIMPVVTYPVVQTFTGVFNSTDGNGGTFVETRTQNSADSKSVAVTFTRTSDGATRTSSLDTTNNGDDTRTVDYSSSEFDQPGFFMSHKTITKDKHGNANGVGTYSTAKGDAGTLTTLETKAETVQVVSAIYTSATTGVTNELRLEDDGFNFKTEKTVTLAPDGKVTTVYRTRYFTGRK